MHRILSSILLPLLCVLAITTHAHAWGEIGKAEKFMKAGMYIQAEELLQKYILEKPDSAEAHFLLGKCYLAQDNSSGADERFRSAVKLDSKYGYQIGPVYFDAGSVALKQNSFYQATALFSQANEYQPSLAPKIAATFLETGMTSLAAGAPDKAAVRFNQAVQYDPALKSKISAPSFTEGMKEFTAGNTMGANECFELAAAYGTVDRAKISGMYFALGNKAPVDNSFGFYQIAASWDSAHNEAIKNRLLEASRACKNQELKGTRYARLRDEAAKFGTVEPDFVVYGPGDEPYFDLKAGEISDKYVRFANEISYEFFSDNKGAYKIRFRNGKEVQMRTGTKLPKNISDFNIYADRDVYVVIEVKPYRP